MGFTLTVLGSNSAVPAHNRFPTSQILQHHNSKYMIDCGEGTQFQLNKYHIKRGNLNHIFISHLHADHFLGVVGLISSLRLNGKTEDLHIYAPPFLKEILDIQLMQDLERIRSFEYVFHPLKFGESYKIYENDSLEVFTIPLDHKIDCNGFLFKEKPKQRKIIGEKIKELDIPFDKINDIKNGQDFTNEQGKSFKNKELTLDPDKHKSYAYCSDTKYNESILPLIKEVDLLYHESTFMHEMKEKSEERFHTTSIQAATIAKKAKVKKLAIGHFSARYRDLNPMLEEAKTVFTNTELALEGTLFEI